MVGLSQGMDSRNYTPATIDYNISLCTESIDQKSLRTYLKRLPAPYNHEYAPRTAMLASYGAFLGRDPYNYHLIGTRPSCPLGSDLHNHCLLGVPQSTRK